jgi:Metal-sensitive transcriptional repressor
LNGDAQQMLQPTTKSAADTSKLMISRSTAFKQTSYSNLHRNRRQVQLSCLILQSPLLQLMSAARGAMNSLMAELLEGHIRNHVLTGKKSNAGQASAAEEVIDMVKSYLR